MSLGHESKIRAALIRSTPPYRARRGGEQKTAAFRSQQVYLIFPAVNSHINYSQLCGQGDENRPQAQGG